MGPEHARVHPVSDRAGAHCVAGATARRPDRIVRDDSHLLCEIELASKIGAIETLDLSRDSSTLVVGGTGKWARVDLASHEVHVVELADAQQPVLPKTTADASVTAIVDARRTSDTLHVYDTHDAAVPPMHLLTITPARGHAITCLDVSSTGELLALGTRDRRITVCAARSGERVASYDVREFVFAFPVVVAFSHSMRWLAFGGDLRKCCVWDLPARSAEPVAVIGRGGYVNCLDFSLDDAQLALGSSGDFLLSIVDTSAWTVTDELRQSKDVFHCAWAADKRTLVATSAGTVSLISSETREVMAELCDAAGHERPRACFGADGSLVVTGAQRVSVYDTRSSNDRVLRETKCSKVACIALSARGTYLALGAASSASLMVLTLGERGAKHAPAAAGAPSAHGASSQRRRHEIRRKGGHARSALAIAFHPSDELTFVAAFRDSGLELYCADDAAEPTADGADGVAGAPLPSAHVSALRRLASATTPTALRSATALRWSPCGTAIAALGSAGVTLHHAATLALTHELALPSDSWLYHLPALGAPAALFGGEAAFCDEPRARSELTRAIIEVGGKRVQALAASHSGRHLAAGGNGVLAIFDAPTLEATHTHSTVGWVMGLRFSPDDATLAIGAHDKTVSVLHVESGLVIHRCGERSYWPVHLCFSADGLTLADGNQALCAYRCSAAPMSLSTPVDPALLLRVRDPAARSAFAGERARTVTELLRQHPAVAINCMPEHDESLQPLGVGEAHGRARLMDVLVSRAERGAVERILAALPSLATLPAAGLESPSFEVAIRLRDVRTLRLLLIAAARGPLPRRSAIATNLIPRIVRLKMGSAVCAFLKQMQLEPSASPIKYACNAAGDPLERMTSALHPTWGGAGTRIWLELDHDPRKAREAAAGLLARGASTGRALGAGGAPATDAEGWQARIASVVPPASLALALSAARAARALWRALGASALAAVALSATEGGGVGGVGGDRGSAAAKRRVGVEVLPKRVPVPYLSSRAALQALGQVPHSGTFDNPCMHATIGALWSRHFYALHVQKTCTLLAHAVVFVFYATRVADGYRTLGQLERAVASTDAVGANGVYMSVAALLLLAFAGVMLRNEVLQFHGIVLQHGLLPGVAQYAMSAWNVLDVFGIAVPAAAVCLEAVNGLSMLGVRMLIALASVLLLVRCVQVLRGFRVTGWRVMVLIQNFKDMTGFLLILLLLTLFFAVAFVMLFGGNLAALELSLEPGGVESAHRAPAAEMPSSMPTSAAGAHAGWPGGDASVPTGFETLKAALISTAKMGMFADFDLAVFEEAAEPSLAKVLFFAFMLVVGVVALNALIALLGDSYAQVQEQQAEQTLRLHALLIVEYYNSSGRFAAHREQSLAWTHVLEVVTDSDADGANGVEWTGQLNLMRHEMASVKQELRKELGAMRSTIYADVQDLIRRENEQLLERLVRLQQPPSVSRQ